MTIDVRPVPADTNAEPAWPVLPAPPADGMAAWSTPLRMCWADRIDDGARRTCCKAEVSDLGLCWEHLMELRGFA